MAASLHNSCFTRCLPFRGTQQRRAVIRASCVGEPSAIKAQPLQKKAIEQRGLGARGLTGTTLAVATAAAFAASPAGAAVLDAAGAHQLADVLRPTFTLFTFLYIVRIPMTWYPSIDGKAFPWVLAYAPTEPVLAVTRKIVPLVGGVDVTPIVWVGLLSFLSEILLGPQGLLVLIERQGGL